MEDKDLFILQSQYHDCWPGEARSQGISSNVIDWILPEQLCLPLPCWAYYCGWSRQIQIYLLTYGSLGPTSHDPYGSQSTGNGSHHWCFYSLKIFRCVPRTQVVFSCDQAAIWLVQSVCPSVCPSVRLSVRLSHLFHHVPIIVSSWNFQELLPMTKVTSMQKVKVRGQRSRSQRSTPNLTVSGL